MHIAYLAVLTQKDLKIKEYGQVLYVFNSLLFPYWREEILKR